MTWHWRLFFLALFAISLLIFLLWQFYLQSLQIDGFAYGSVTAQSHQQQLIIDGSVAGQEKKPLILVWTRIFQEQSLKLESDCPLYDQCLITYDHGLLQHSNAVVFHVADIKWVHQLKPAQLAYDLPDIPDIPPFNKTKLNVFMSQENPTTLARLYMLKELQKKTHNYFHWLMTHLISSHVPMPYGGFFIPPKETKQLGFTPINLPSDAETILANKTIKGILWMVSNCESNSKRELAVKALAKHIPVIIGGKCAKTQENRELCPRSTPNGCDHLFRQYYFYIAAENDNCRDYVTEKYWSRYQLPAIPIVMRKHIYERIVPNNSFIAMDQFDSPRSMAAHLHHLMDNPQSYLTYFHWRTQNWSIAPWNHAGYRIGQCALCERLLRLRDGKEFFPDPLTDAADLFERQSQCEGGTFAEQWAEKENNGN